MLNNIYKYLPVFIQNALISLKGLYIQKTRFNSKFKKYLSLFEQNDPYKVDGETLHAFLKNAQKSIFWKERFNKYGIDLQNADLISEIQKLPILAKDEVQNNIEKIKINDVNDKIIKASTGGTTGTGLIFQQTQRMINKQWAVWSRYRRRHGIDLNSWMGWFGGKIVVDVSTKKTPFWRINYPGRQVLFSQFHLNIDTVECYYNEIINRRIKWLHGYPSVLANFASLIHEKGLSSLSLNYVTIGAENLLEHQINIIEKTFGVKPIQHYGLAEGVANISELPNGELQIDQDFAFVELIPVNSHNNLYRIIGTNYSNDSFPLIRYDTKDLVNAYFDKGHYKIISIDGRKEDYITLPNGNRIGRLAAIFKNATYVNEAQLYQPDVNNIILRIVRGISYDKDIHESIILRECRSRFGAEINIKFDYVNKIERTISGKLRYVISDVNNLQ